MSMPNPQAGLHKSAQRFDFTLGFSRALAILAP